ncbi:MAG: hypothetical protein R2818_04060 [Flavobacteriales bacterium]
MANCANLSGRDGALAYVLTDTDTIIRIHVEATNVEHRAKNTAAFPSFD